MVLYRLDLKTKNGFEVERSDKFFTFSKHTETCYVCNTLTNVVRNKKVPVINIHQQLKAIVSKHGFDCYNENNKNYFVIIETNCYHQVDNKILSLESNGMRLIVLNREVPLSNNIIKSLPEICSEVCCDSCTIYRTSLHVMDSRRKSNENQSSITSNSKKNDRYFSKSELLTKIKLLEKERKDNLAKQQRMQKKLENL